MNCFKFYPVGQGLFYTGSLAHRTFNFVYDCGTKSKNKYLLSSIDSYIQDIQKEEKSRAQIDFVVISHLHEDHFNGLFDLAQKANIHRVYLPYLGYDKNFISLVLAHIIFENTQEYQNSQQPHLLFHFMCSLYGIEDNDFPRIESVFFESEKSDEYLSGDFVCSVHENYAYIGSEKYWKFIFVNRAISRSKIKMLNERLSEIMDYHNIDSIVGLLNLADGIKQISDIYKEVFFFETKKDSNFLNNTSIVLIHYPLYNFPNAFYADEKDVIECAQRKVETRYFSHWYPCDYNCFNFKRLRNASTILSGDVMVDNIMGKIILSQLKQFAAECRLPCGVLQVPHHGSEHNWKAWRNTSIDSQVYVIPFGLGNKDKHPHSNTVDSLISMGGSIHLVNQIQDFEYYID